MSPAHPPKLPGFAPRLCSVLSVLWLAACATVPIREGGALASYDGLQAQKAQKSRARLRVDADAVIAAKTVRIMPTRFAAGVGDNLSEKQRMLLGNRVDRALCRSLARRLDVVAGDGDADLTVQSTVTHFGGTNKIAAGASVVTSFVSIVPLFSPRVPFGLGSLGIEAEAVGASGRQEAAMLWTAKAQPIGIMSNASISRVGDAYQLSSEFGSKFGELVATGRSPYGRSVKVKLPKLGGKKDAECAVFGKDGGIAGMVADNFGAPPGWTDRGARKVVASTTPPAKAQR